MPPAASCCGSRISTPGACGPGAPRPRPIHWPGSGLDWDGAPVAQSQRGELYDAALARLAKGGLLYECFCSRADVRRAASAPHGPDGPLYSGACRDLSPGEREARRALGRPPALRVRMEGAVAFRDELAGPQREQLEETTGDIVLRRSDGVVAYQLAVVVDDAAQGVTHVVRGADLLASTARQIRLYELLDLGPAPAYAHVPLLLGEDDERLAKRHGAVGLTELRDGGADPRAVVGRLAHSAGLIERPEPCTPSALVESFDPGALGREPARVDPAFLRW